MPRFILRRCAYSLLILLGVMLITFALFRVAAGDPAAAVLGKNPSPEQLELMRRKLGTDKPLVFGSQRPSEVYSACGFANSRELFPGLEIRGKAEPGTAGLLVFPGTELVFRRNFPLKNEPVYASVSGGRLSADGKTSGCFEFRSAPETLVFKNDSTSPVRIAKISFARKTAGLFDSQLTDSFREIVSFRKTFPYVSFFNFGETLLTREPIREVLWRGMGASLALMIPVFFGELFAGIVLAMISAACRGRWPDRLLMLLSVAGMSISYLALIILCQWLFGYWLNLFPVWGWGSPKYLVLPVLVGIISGTGGGVRFYRSVFLNEMNREYLRTAAAKGCSPFKLYFKHLLKNAAVPIITRASTVLPFLFTGSLLLESFFGIPGLGYKGIDALNSSDLQTLKALVLLGSFLFVLINLITDLLYAWVDPRIRAR